METHRIRFGATVRPNPCWALAALLGGHRRQEALDPGLGLLDRGLHARVEVRVRVRARARGRFRARARVRP